MTLLWLTSFVELGFLYLLFAELFYDVLFALTGSLSLDLNIGRFVFMVFLHYLDSFNLYMNISSGSVKRKLFFLL